MAVDLTTRVRQVIAHFFQPATGSFVGNLLVDECGSNLPLYIPTTPEGLERVQLAVLKISNGDEDKLLEAHKKWAEELR